MLGGVTHQCDCGRPLFDGEECCTPCTDGALAAEDAHHARRVAAFALGNRRASTADMRAAVRVSRGYA